MRIQAVVLLVLISGCVGTVDRLTPIEGELVFTESRPLNRCLLQAVDATTARAIPDTQAEVSGQFRTGLANPPRSGRYFITIDCGPRSVPFRSQEMDFSIVKPIDLGRIVIATK